MTNKKALIIRFSSFGDIVQSSFAAEELKRKDIKTDLLTKSEFAKAFKGFDVFNEVIAFDKKTNVSGLFKLAKELCAKNYDLVYDAHNNQRTLLLKLFFLILKPSYILKLKTRSKYRIKRFFLFKLRINLFPKPFKGAESFLEPLGLNIKEQKNTLKQKHNTPNTILLAPSAAWDLKKWPTEYWVELASKLSTQDRNLSIKFLGGPDDHFIDGIQKQVPQTQNLAGKLSWSETIDEIKNSRMLISGDTGVLHIADFFKVKAIGLMGPSAFGYPSRETSKVLSLNLNCQPCSKDGRGKCKLINENKKCLTALKPELVLNEINKELNS